MKLPKVSDLKVANKKVLVRCDFDVPLVTKEKGTIIGDETRLQLCLKTIHSLLEKKARVIIIAHLGRPGGKRIEGLSLKPAAKYFASLLGSRTEVEFFPYVLGKRVKEKVASLNQRQILILENLRFYSEEEKNDPGFSKSLASLADFFVNEAFAVSHREHASIVGLPTFLPSAFGFNFVKEVRTLTRVYRHPQRPVVIVLGGQKKSKILAGQILLGWVDNILVGGELVEADGIVEFAGHKKVRADLTKKGEDITLSSAKEFAKIIKKAGTVIWSGPMGAYESYRYLKGTEIVAKAVADSKAFSIVGGGDTEAALTKLGLVEKIDYICSGGGAMLTFLAQQGTLPGIKAVIRKSYIR
jgi:phosphoglycerate kinase